MTRASGACEARALPSPSFSLFNTFRILVPALELVDISGLKLFTIDGWGTDDNYRDFIEVSVL